MDEFPENLTPENKADFPEIRYTLLKSYLRHEITNNVLEGNENNYFDLSTFSVKYNINIDLLEKMCNDITKELLYLGWNVKTSFAGTGLFIYSTEMTPPSCYDDSIY